MGHPEYLNLEKIENCIIDNQKPIKKILKKCTNSDYNLSKKEKIDG